MATETPAMKPEAAGEEQKALTPPPSKQIVPHIYQGEDDPTTLYMSTTAFDQLQRVANLMANSTLVPEHLQGKLSNCFLVAAQAIRWKIDPFLCAQKTFVLRGKLGYEGQLIAAVINTNPRVSGSLQYKYSGKVGTPERGIVVSGSLRSNPGNVLEVEGTVGQWATKEKDSDRLSQQWLRDPDQMLAYRGARQWARRHMPEAVLGVYSQDEIEAEVFDLNRQADGSFAPPEPPPTPAARLEKLTEKVKTKAEEEKKAKEPKEPKEPTTILEAQLKKSLEMLGPKPLCLHPEEMHKHVSTGAVICGGCGELLVAAPRG